MNRLVTLGKLCGFFGVFALAVHAGWGAKWTEDQGENSKKQTQRWTTTQPTAPVSSTAPVAASTTTTSTTTATPGTTSTATVTPTATVTATTLGKYVVIGWNDLGMHCIGPRFAHMSILPPYNTVQAVVIRRGGEPELMGETVKITYAMDNNTTVTGKTDFWQYSLPLFGVALKPGIGLTGRGLSGTMSRIDKLFEAKGIPALPFNDQLVWNPYQTATLKAYVNGTLVDTTKIVVPVSDEMNCAKCHSTGGVAAAGISAPTMEENILTLHDKKEGTKLMSQQPVNCAKCHADAALGAAGVAGVKNLSLAMHGKHSTVATLPACYDCHPGVKTQCNRSAWASMGPKGTDPQCAKCHGDLKAMTAKLAAGRQPWVQEPTCAQCHGAAYSTGTTLYRNAKGHGGIMCVTCHNSPHAWLPSLNALDNAQALRLQGSSRTIGYNGCKVCHTDGRTGTKPPHQDD